MAAKKNRVKALAITVGAILVLGIALSLAPGWKTTAPEMSQPVTSTAKPAISQPLPADNPFNQQQHVRERQIQLRFQQAVMMLHAKRYEEAVAALHEVLRIEPKLVDAHVNMGFALLELGSPKAAADFFFTATELRPLQANAYYGLAEAYDQLGLLRMAIDAMETYVHLPEAVPKFKRKAQSALWEWREALKNARESEQPIEPNNIPAEELPAQAETASTTTDEADPKMP